MISYVPPLTISVRNDNPAVARYGKFTASCTHSRELAARRCAVKVFSKLPCRKIEEDDLIVTLVEIVGREKWRFRVSIKEAA